MVLIHVINIINTALTDTFKYIEVSGKRMYFYILHLI